MLDFCRALQGLGVAASLPTGAMLMGSLHRSEPRNDLVFTHSERHFSNTRFFFLLAFSWHEAWIRLSYWGFTSGLALISEH